jgi:Uma2 family endonuclease
MVAERESAAPAQTSGQRMPHTPRELFDALPPLPGLRAEIIEGVLIVSPMGSPEHTFAAVELNNALIPLLTKRGWRGSPGGLHVCIEGPRDSTIPDYLLIPANCPRWGAEFMSSHVIMAAEVASPSSTHIDRVEKKKLYALGRVPVYLLIDPLADNPAVTVFTQPEDCDYRVSTRVGMDMGLYLPAPVDFELDTSIFKV